MTTIVSFIRHPQRLLDISWQEWLRIAMIPGAVLVSALLGYRLPPGRFSLVLAFFVGLAGMFILLERPGLGLLSLIPIGMAVRYYGPAGLNASVILVALMTVLWLVDMLVRRRRFTLVPSRTTLPVLVLMGVALLAFLFGQFPWFSFAQNAPMDAQLGGLAIFIFSASAFLLVANQVRNVRWLEAMTWLFLVLGGLLIIGRLLPTIIGPLSHSVFTSGAIGGVFYAWLPALALSQGLLNKDLKLGWRVVLIGLVVATLYVAYVYNYDWKSGWIPSFIAVGVITWLYSWKLALTVTLVFALPVITLVPQYLSSDAYSISTRFDAWQIMLEIIKVSPVLGLGFANYYWYTPLFRIRGWEVRFNSHNNYVDIVAQTGLVGLLCFFWFFIEIAWLAWELRKRVPPGGFAHAYVYGAFGGIAGTLAAAMLGDWVLSFVYNVGFGGFRTGVLAWVFLGGLVVLEQIYIRNNVAGRSDQAAVRASHS